MTADRPYNFTLRREFFAKALTDQPRRDLRVDSRTFLARVFLAAWRLRFFIF